MAGPTTPEGIAKVTQNLPAQMPPEWEISEKGKEAIRVAVSMAQMKHGLVAGVPIICKGAECPFGDTCYLLTQKLDVPGERCPLEIATIIERFNAYMEELDIEEDHTTDMALLKNLVDIEVQLVRADRKMASSVDIIEDVIVAVGDNGQPFYKPEINKAAEYKLKLLNEHSKVLSYLHATRKDKASEKHLTIIDASNYAAKLLEAKQKMDAEVIDIGPASTGTSSTE